MGMTEVVDKSGDVHQAYKLKKPSTVIETYDAADYQKAAPKTLSGVLQRDPLAKAEAKAVEKKAKEATQKIEPTLLPEPVATSPKDASVDQDTGEVIPNSPVAVEGVDSDEADLLSDTPSTNQPQPVEVPAGPPVTVVSQPPAQELTGKIKEAAEVKFSDLVPEEIRKEIKTTLTIELLGKVIKAWRERGEQSTTMRMTDNGAAIAMEFLGTLMRSIPDWANEMAAAGLIYAPPDRPGLKVQKVAIPEGSKAKEAIVISRYGCKKLGL
jgi:hypothetical protein